MKIIEGVVDKHLIPSGSNINLGEEANRFDNIIANNVTGQNDVKVGNAVLYKPSPDNNRTLTLPSTSGTLALTSQITADENNPVGIVGIRDNSSLSGSVKLRGGDFDLIRVLEKGATKTYLIAASLEVLRVLFTANVNTGTNSLTSFKSAHDSSVYSGFVFANAAVSGLEITQHGNSFICEFNNVGNATIDNYNGLFEALTISGFSPERSVLWGRDVVADNIVARKQLWVEGRRISALTKTTTKVFEQVVSSGTFNLNYVSGNSGPRYTWDEFDFITIRGDTHDPGVAMVPVTGFV